MFQPRHRAIKQPPRPMLFSRRNANTRGLRDRRTVNHLTRSNGTPSRKGRWLLRIASRVKYTVHHLVARRKLGIIAPPMLDSCVHKLLPQKIAHLFETRSQRTALYPIFAVELPDHKLAVG